jgi:hypothetical protein
VNYDYNRDYNKCSETPSYKFPSFIIYYISDFGLISVKCSSWKFLFEIK